MTVAFPKSLGGIDALRASVWSEDYYRFALAFWETIPGITPLVPNWHLQLYARELQFILDRVIKGQPRAHDLVCNVPFGTSKSTFFSVLLQPWGWTRAPWLRFLYATHTDSLALDLAGKAKDVIESEKYQHHYPHVKIRRDKSAREDYANTLGGERKSCTVGGKTPTGRHAHVIGIDDPIDPQGARSSVELDTAEKFCTEVVPSRMVDKKLVPTFLVQQRLDPRDPTDVMLKVSRREGGVPVRHICLPGELGGSAGRVSPPLEELRQTWPEAYEEGLLDTKRLDRDVLRMFQAKLGPFAYAAQVGQNPTAREGGMWQASYFDRRVRAAPREALRVRFWDRAQTQSGGCYTAGVLMAKDTDGRFYVEHCEHGQWNPKDRNERMIAAAKRDRLRYGPRHEPTVLIEEETGSTGAESFEWIAGRLAGYRVKSVKVTGSKDSRAEPWSDQCAAGNVYLVDGGQSTGTGTADWDVDGFIEEHIRFRPELGKRLGKYKDQVDACSGAFNYLANVNPVPEVRIIKFRADGKVKFPPLICCPLSLLPQLEADGNALLVQIADPDSGVELHPVEGTPTKLTDRLLLTFADLDPKDYQDRWEQPVEPYGKLPEQLIMTRDEGKKLWRFLSRDRGGLLHTWIFADNGDGDRRANSVIKAVCDVIGAPCTSIYFANPDTADGEGKAPPPNGYVFEMTKSCRGLVI